MKTKKAKPFNASRATIEHMTSEGWSCWNVESQIPHTFIKRDCFKFADILAMSPARGIALIQSTGGTNFSTRLKKIKAEPYHAIWLASGGRIILHSWEGVGKIRSLRSMEITKEETI